MITDKQLKDLLSSWKTKFDKINSEEAFDVLYECICDVAEIISPNSAEGFCDLVMANVPSVDVEESLKEIEADNYLSTIEAHEPAV